MEKMIFTEAVIVDMPQIGRVTFQVFRGRHSHAFSEFKAGYLAGLVVIGIAQTLDDAIVERLRVGILATQNDGTSSSFYREQGESFDDLEYAARSQVIENNRDAHSGGYLGSGRLNFFR